MLGFADPIIALVYWLNIAAVLLCVVYGLVNWDKGNEHETEEIKEEKKWETKEKIIDKKMA